MQYNYTKSPLIAFRQCQLKDVYFADCYMALFSFYRSAFFEEAHFVSCEWRYRDERIISFLPFSFIRKNQIYEDLVYAEPIKQTTDKIDFPEKYSEIADLYRRMKTALDRRKDYPLAGWFYFNEFEMKRKRYKERMKEDYTRWEKVVFVGKRFLYSCYKLFAGYGEKPFWSFVWLCLFSTFFAVRYLFRGLQLPDNNIIQYKLTKGIPDLGILISDLFYSFLFTFSRIIPVNYIPFDRTKFAPLHDDLFISLANSFILVILIIFIGIGLKRRFRRF